MHMYVCTHVVYICMDICSVCSVCTYVVYVCTYVCSVYTYVCTYVVYVCMQCTVRMYVHVEKIIHGSKDLISGHTSTHMRVYTSM